MPGSQWRGETINLAELVAELAGHESKGFRLDSCCPTCERAVQAFPFAPPCELTYWSDVLPIAMVR